MEARLVAAAASRRFFNSADRGGAAAVLARERPTLDLLHSRVPVDVLGDVRLGVEIDGILDPLRHRLALHQLVGKGREDHSLAPRDDVDRGGQLAALHPRDRVRRAALAHDDRVRDVRIPERDRRTETSFASL